MAAVCQEALAGIDMACTVGAGVRLIGHGVSIPYLAEMTPQEAEAAWTGTGELSFSSSKFSITAGKSSWLFSHLACFEF
jgi:hypothetical protein